MSVATGQLLSASKLDVSVPGRALVQALDFELRAGEVVALLGRNGAGKTLTLSTLAGIRPPDGGDVAFDGRSLADADRRWLARRLGLMPQHAEDVFPASVAETVMIGRYPHGSRFRPESREDETAVRAALEELGLGGLAERDILTLSGGERRRAAAAQILVQQPSAYLLDEPGNHLDPQHQIDVMQLFRRKADDGAGVIASVHDINLAARFADRCLMLFGDGRWLLGDSSEVLTTDTLTALYGTDICRIESGGRVLFASAGLLGEAS